jgi:gluconolactonase
MKRYLIAVALGVTTCDAAPPLPAAADVQPQPIATFASFGEGIVFDSDTTGFLSDLNAGVIYRFTIDGRLTEWARSAQPNGHRILSDGTHLVADASEHAVLRFDSNGRRLAPLTHSAGVPFVAPNDLTVDTQGGAYFTDLREFTATRGTVHYVDRRGQVSTVATELAGPNGIVIDPQGRWLYVTESLTGRVARFRVEGPGRLGPVETFAVITENLKPSEPEWQLLDGMTVDQHGRLYIAYHRVGRIYVLDTTGAIVRRYAAGQHSVSNVAFGGPSLRYLYAVGAKASAGSPGMLTRLDLSPVRGWRAGF